MDLSTTTDICSRRQPNERTWDLLLDIVSDHEVLQRLIQTIEPLVPFSDEMEFAIYEFVEEAIEAHVIIPSQGKFNPKEINWTDIVYGLLRAYQHIFDEIRFNRRYKLDPSSFIHSSRPSNDLGDKG